VVALVHLEEGPQLLTNIIEYPVEEIAVGMKVQLVFERCSDDAATPRFTADRKSGRK
jgi:uncharacterized OB-fold protein